MDNRFEAGCGGRSETIRYSDVISALSYALDITEGQPEGHSVRSCLIGMRLAEELRLGDEERSALFYALLLKDVGCSGTAAKYSELFGADDRTVKRDLKTSEWARTAGSVPSLYRDRSDRGSAIIRKLGFPEATASAIAALDEHWDGRGQPDGLSGPGIPLLGRIVGLAQSFEVFSSAQGFDEACAMAERRQGSWFDPDLVRILLSLRRQPAFRFMLTEPDARQYVSAFEPGDSIILADDERLDRAAEAFSLVVDAKSTWTYHHSTGVANIAVAICRELDFPDPALRTMRRAALLHDIGKLGVSNLILDKADKLTDDEWSEMRRHPLYSRRILERVPCFSELAELVETHHERLDGLGYPHGLGRDRLTQASRVLVVADIYDALSSDRPYRRRLDPDHILDYFERDRDVGLCAECVDALKAALERGLPEREGSGLVPLAASESETAAW